MGKGVRSIKNQKKKLSEPSPVIEDTKSVGIDGFVGHAPVVKASDGADNAPVQLEDSLVTWSVLFAAEDTTSVGRDSSLFHTSIGADSILVQCEDDGAVVGHIQ